ncbi:hypothetical protein [Odoribacter lunatus]|uniref:hypothetical protein n=1 Tax=Odoribacter lunatus TaxID=2941335 RepID=UPI00203B343B|nr:hypothetical protein [Odoribacter lunatus]
MKKQILLGLAICLSHLLSAQSLNINGTLVIENASSEGARIVILRNNIELERKEISKRGRFDLKLGTGADYRLSFEKDGYITKIVNINTDVPDEIIQTNPDFPPVKLIVTLLPQVEGVDISIFEQAIANLSYNYELDDFTFDKEYAEKIKGRIAKTEQEIRKALAQRGSEALAREQLFTDLCTKGENAFNRKQWQDAIANWQKALEIKPDKKELEEKIAIAQKENEREQAEKSIAAQNARTYKMLITSGDSLFALKDYTAAKEKFTMAKDLPVADKYPLQKIAEIDAIITKAESDKQKQEEAARRQQEERQKAELMSRYNQIIAEADAAFKTESYAIARTHYTEADQLNTGETYPKNRIKEIDNILNSAKYQQRLAEFNHNKELAENALAEKNYAGAKVYYEKAASILPIDKEEIQKKIAEVNKLIEAEQLALRNKEYQEQIQKADKAYKEKSYAIAKFYYQKALEIKKDDKYAKEKLNEVEKQINARTEKTVEL